jgi:hypothetical protein
MHSSKPTKEHATASPQRGRLGQPKQCRLEEKQCNNEKKTTNTRNEEIKALCHQYFYADD